jgi:hypothetical protein
MAIVTLSIYIFYWVFRTQDKTAASPTRARNSMRDDGELRRVYETGAADAAAGVLLSQ